MKVLTHHTTVPRHNLDTNIASDVAEYVMPIEDMNRYLSDKYGVKLANTQSRTIVPMTPSQHVEAKARMGRV